MPVRTHPPSNLPVTPLLFRKALSRTERQFVAPTHREHVWDIGGRDRLFDAPVIRSLAARPAAGKNVGIGNRFGPCVGQLHIQTL